MILLLCKKGKYLWKFVKTVFKRKDEGLVKVAMRGTTPVKHVLVEDHFWKKYKQIVANEVIPLSMESIK